MHFLDRAIYSHTKAKLRHSNKNPSFCCVAGQQTKACFMNHFLRRGKFIPMASQSAVQKHGGKKKKKSRTFELKQRNKIDSQIKKQKTTEAVLRGSNPFFLSWEKGLTTTTPKSKRIVAELGQIAKPERCVHSPCWRANAAPFFIQLR